MARTEVRGGQILDASVSLTADVTGVLPVANGGTNASSASAARTSLGVNTAAEIILAPGAFASRPAAGTAGRRYVCTDIGNEYRDNGTTWDMVRGGALTIFTPPPSSGWTALNSGSISTGLDSRIHSLAATSGDNIKGEYRTLSPTSNYTATFYFDWSTPGINQGGTGILLRNSGGNNIIIFGAFFESGLGNWTLRAVKWSSVTTYSADYKVNAVTLLSNGLPNWLRIRDDATTRFFEYSYNAADWVTFHSVGRTDFITPDQIGWCTNANNTGGAYTAITRMRSLAGVA